MFILKGKILRFTKEIINPVKIILLSIIFLVLVILIKYKPVYLVTLSGKTLGYVTEKSELENKINEYINTREGTVALIDIEVMPEYTLDLVSKDEETKENDILEEVEKTAVITYKTYGVTVNGEVKTEVDTEAKALEIINNLGQDVEEGVDFELGYTEIYTVGENTFASEDEAIGIVSEIKTAKVTEYEEEQARIAAEKAAAEAAAKEAARKAAAAKATYTSTSTTVSGSYGNVNGISISNPLKASALITSRFGERSSSRSSSHTGLDLATSLGTSIYPIASGTVVTASYQGSYGNMIVIDHGNGVQSYYAHCNSINVGVGSSVTTDTIIGTVGSTGNSTGPHLHLEIRINGVAYNPQNYLY